MQLMTDTSSDDNGVHHRGATAAAARWLVVMAVELVDGSLVVVVAIDVDRREAPTVVAP